MINKNYHSCFIIDVNINGNNITLTDSVKCKWNIDITSEEKISNFKFWLSHFLKGISQTLTVFEYEFRGDDPDQERWITKFYINKNNSSLITG